MARLRSASNTSAIISSAEVFDCQPNFIFALAGFVNRLSTSSKRPEPAQFRVHDIARAAAANDAKHLVVLAEQGLRQVGPILTGYPRDQSTSSATLGCLGELRSATGAQPTGGGGLLRSRPVLPRLGLLSSRAPRGSRLSAISDWV